MSEHLISLRDFDHLLRGGTLKCGDAEIVLDDVGFQNFQRVIHKATVEMITRGYDTHHPEWSAVGTIREVKG